MKKFCKPEYIEKYLLLKFTFDLNIVEQNGQILTASLDLGCLDEFNLDRRAKKVFQHRHLLIVTKIMRLLVFII